MIAELHLVGLGGNDLTLPGFMGSGVTRHDPVVTNMSSTAISLVSPPAVPLNRSM